MPADWGTVFLPAEPWAELVARGSAIYWFVFVLFRIILRRDIGSIGMADVLVVVLIADAAQNAMDGGYESVGDGFIVISTLVFWNVLIDWLTYRFEPLRKLLEPRPLKLVQNGRLLRRNMRREFVSEEDLLSRVRAKGLERFDQVKAAYMESDGEISVIRKPRAPS